MHRAVLNVCVSTEMSQHSYKEVYDIGPEKRTPLTPGIARIYFLSSLKRWVGIYCLQDKIPGKSDTHGFKFHIYSRKPLCASVYGLLTVRRQRLIQLVFDT